MLKVSPPISFPQICTICIKESLCMSGLGNTNFSQHPAMLQSRDTMAFYKAVKEASVRRSVKFTFKRVLYDTMEALLVYAADTSAPHFNDSFAIIWRGVSEYTKQWIAQGMSNLHLDNRKRWEMMQRDLGPYFMPAPAPPWEPETLNAAACMQTSARPNPYIAQALNR